jgi:hypothetical protein
MEGCAVRRFQNVDIISTLRKVVDNNNLHYKTDFEYDVDTLKTAAAGSRFLWLSRYSGTWLANERDAHIRNTEAHNTWTKRMLNFFMAGNTLDTLPLTKPELSALYQLALDRGKEGIKDPRQSKIIHNVVRVIDTMLDAEDGYDAPPRGHDNGHDEDMEP